MSREDESELVEPAQELPNYNEAEAIAFIQKAGLVRGRHETVVRETVVAGFFLMFPTATRPWWVERHTRGAESLLEFYDEKQTIGYADSIVGLTAIEYESDLTNTSKLRKGKHQVHQYCTGLLNTGADASKVRGVLSDGVEWRAYELVGTYEKRPGTYGVSDVTLQQLGPTLKCSAADASTAERLVDFLTRHLGREGARPLTGKSVAEYLGFDSGFGQTYLQEFDQFVRVALREDPESAALIERIWTRFVSYLSVEDGAPTFEIDTYVQEFYIATLAKLLCANVVERRAIRSDNAELHTILTGGFFEAKGLRRFIEHDYFGWLNSPQHCEKVYRLACLLQGDLAAYDFETTPSDDVFGEMIAALAQRTQRILLGQECTPKWLATEMADALFERLDDETPPRFVDMCCGSGSMLVAATEQARARLERRGLKSETTEYLDSLVQTCTGFDIDPLAVVLAKVNWVQTNRDVLEPFDGSRQVSLPVYHADSLFALAPVFADSVDPHDTNVNYRLRLYDIEVDLPRFLIRPERQAIFDELLEGAYALSRALSKDKDDVPAQDLVARIIADADSNTNDPLQDHETAATRHFLTQLVKGLATLQREGKNGVWVFVIRNAYRPGLVAGQFNGLISNPPWLALSKIANNPFASVLKNKATEYALNPPGAAFPHLEMATIFLAHAVDHYLAADAVISCIVPDTVRNGQQHRPFREQTVRHNATPASFDLQVDELWIVRQGVFKNRAVVVLGTKAVPKAKVEIPGRKVPGTADGVMHYISESSNRMVWSENPPGQGVAGAYTTGFAIQGADVMPRRLVFFETSLASGDRVTLRAIERDSEQWFLWSDAKKHDGFDVVTRTIPDRFVHPTYLSKHVGPYALADPSLAILPILFDNGHWRVATDAEITLNTQARDHFAAIIAESDFNSLTDFWERGIDMRAKLSLQRFTPGMWIAVYGAGGGIPAAGYFQTADIPIIIDQTLYWAECTSEDEAVYFCGIVNSRALLQRIEDFIPEGDFGKRHLHTLPAKAVPQFDASDEGHRAEVAATRSLIGELAAAAKASDKVAQLFTTEVTMNSRRTRLRKTMKDLEAYEPYEAACAAVIAAATPGYTIESNRE